MEKTYMDVEALKVYRRLCKRYIEVCDLSHEWPQEERYELNTPTTRGIESMINVDSRSKQSPNISN